MKTIVGSARIVVRATSESHRLVRAVDAIGYMQMIGWDRSMWRTGGDIPSLDLCSELAGNAFAGFAVGPMLSAAFAASGHGLLLSEGVKQGESSLEGEDDGSCDGESSYSFEDDRTAG